MTKKTILVILFGLTVFCKVSNAAQDPNDLKKNESITLKIKKFNVGEKLAVLEYVVDNNSTNDIWHCDSIDVHGAPVETVITQESLLINLRFDLPKWIFLEEPLLSRYIFLKSGSVYQGKLSLKLPIVNESPTEKDDIDDPNDIVKLNKIVFKVGYFNEDFGKALLDDIKKISSKDEGEHLMALSLKHANEGSDLSKVIYILDYWKEEQQMKEKSLITTMENVKIPCYFHKK